MKPEPPGWLRAIHLLTPTPPKLPPHACRFHNPDNYCRALGGVLRSRGTSWQRLMRHASQSGLRWHVSALEQRPGVQVAASRRQGGGKLHGVQRGLRGELAEAAARLEGC